MTSKKNIKDPEMQLTSYYAASVRYRGMNTLLMFVIVIVTLLLAFVIYLNQTSIWVATPGQSFEATRAFEDPYRGYTSQEHMIEYCELMFTFSPDGFEENIEQAKHLSIKSVYDKWYNFYYVEKQASGQPAYYSWVENSIIVELQIDSTNHRFLEGGNIYTRLYGKRIFKKDYDYYTRDEIAIEYEAIIELLPYKNKDNRRGMRIIDFQVVKSEAL